LVSIIIQNVNEKPYWTEPVVFEVEENTVFNGMVSASDVDENDVLTYELLNDAPVVESSGLPLYTLSSSGAFSVIPMNFEAFVLPAPAVYTNVVRVTDKAGSSTDSTFTITVLDVNEAPVVVGASFQVDENGASGEVLGIVTVYDPDNYAGLMLRVKSIDLGVDLSLFTLSPSSLVAVTPNSVQSIKVSFMCGSVMCRSHVCYFFEGGCDLTPGLRVEEELHAHD
jgi:hypothetical protein